MPALAAVFDGWNGYQTSLCHAVQPLNTAQLLWRPAPRIRSLGETIRHISLGRVDWLSRIAAPGIEDICQQVPGWYTDSDGVRHISENSVPSDQSDILNHWLELSSRPIRQLLEEWTVEDLFRTHLHKYRGTQYKISNQWTLWRIMSHDVHHGGQLAMMLACQKIPAFELRTLGGHIVAAPEVPPE